MKTLRELIKEELLLEKRIAQISSSIEISFSFMSIQQHILMTKRLELILKIIMKHQSQMRKLETLLDK